MKAALVVSSFSISGTLAPDKKKLLLTSCLKRGKKIVTVKVRKLIVLYYIPWEEANHDN